MPFTQEQRQNAATILRVGREVGASSRDMLIALMTAMQESGLRNVNYGDRDSLGLFQQRPSQSWGSQQQVRNPEYAARAFFLGAGTNRGLLDYDNRHSMSLTAAAQQVQRSGFPDAYAKHEGSARTLLEQLGDGKGVEGTLGTVPGYTVDQPTIGEALTETLGDHPAVAQPEEQANALAAVNNPMLDEYSNPVLDEQINPVLGTSTFDGLGMDSEPGGIASDMILPGVEELTGKKVDYTGAISNGREKVINFARNMLGVPYVWGGTSVNGVDCSGLLVLAYQKAGINLPRLSADQARSGRRVSLDKLRPGDIAAIDNSSRNNGADHIGIYVGNGKVIHSPRPGASVEISGLQDVFGGGWGVALDY